MLGRSSAKGSFQINTQKFQSIQFHDSFTVTGEDLGSAVTLGSGVGLYIAAQASKANGKTIVAGKAASASVGAGWFQAGGHGFMSTKLGLGADNLLRTLFSSSFAHVVSSRLIRLLVSLPCRSHDRACKRGICYLEQEREHRL